MMDSPVASSSSVTNIKSEIMDTENIITEEMMKEELLLEEKLKADEKAEKLKLDQIEKQIEEDKCYKQLNLLLSRSSIYAKFMAEKLQKHEDLMQKKNCTKKSQDKKVGNSESRGKKRKALGSPVKKKVKSDATLMDVLRKENIAKQITEELPTEDSPLYSSPTSAVDVAALQPKLMTGGLMRQYQYDGYEWMKTLFENGVNGILADEMGLGKTIQCIAFIAYLIEMGVSGPFFICGPLSTVPNWCSEFARFTPDIPVILYHGDRFERDALRKKIKNKVKVRSGYSCPVVITSYAIALIDASPLKRIEWKMLVIDEAHRIKNFGCKLVTTLKTYNAVHRLLLTGTPLQNNLTELWSLLNFILPEIFDNLKVFQSWFDVHRFTNKGFTREILAREQEKQIVSTIHQILTPFLLRRTKSDVNLDIPNKKEVIVECPLSSLQQKYYSECLKRSIYKLMEKEGKNVTDFAYDERKNHKRVSKPTDYFGVKEGNVLSNIVSRKESELFSDNIDFAEINLNTRNITMCLRRICCHPYLIKYPLDPATEDYLVDENIVLHSGKFLVLDVLLPELKKRGHKILLFSQFVTLIEILQDYLTYRGYQYTRLIGSMSLSERQDQIEQFNHDPEKFIFLISTKAGGLGINLVAADTVIVFDSDWNPQGDLQAQDRCHRIGQTKPVVVFRLLIPNTVDQKVFEIATAKRKLEKVIIQKGRFASKMTLTSTQPLVTLDELRALLEACEVEGLVKTDPKNVLSPEQLEKLLDRSDLMSPAESSVIKEESAAEGEF